MSLAALLLSTAALASASTTQFGAAGSYDSLVLARFWEPQAHPCGTFGGEGNLTLHGLWPQYATHHTPAPHGLPGDWPQYCGKNSSAFWGQVQPVSPGVAAAFSAEWAVLAPDYVAGTLAQHEWEKHGTCWSADVTADLSASGVAQLQTQFFNASLRLMAQYPTPAAVSRARAAKTGLSVAQLQGAFGGADMVGLSCRTDHASGKISLSMVILCFDSDSHGGPTQRVACPAATLLASSYDNGCATQATEGELVYVDQPCGTHPPSPPRPSPPAPAGATCVLNTHGPKCSTDTDCASVPHCIRCAESGYCTEQARLPVDG